MKKVLSSLVFGGVLVLSACGSNEEASKPAEEPKAEEAQTEAEATPVEEEAAAAEANEAEAETEKAEDTDTPVSETESGEKYQEGFGQMKVVGVGYNEEIGIDGSDAPVKPVKMGDMNLYINGGGIMDIELDEEAKYMFDDQDNVRAIIMDLKAENTADKDVTFHPNQSIIVTDTGEQIEAEMMMMGEAGGDFLGKVTKEGQAWWLVKDLNKDIKKFTLIVSPAYLTDSMEEMGEEQRIEFEVVSFEESKKREAANK
ncbi:hypothetical protein [Metabacillus sp. 84]|uniref:hypothetical protein n=1 Tax=Metabacillus sp. 84 TaxID=3404705 RepID=UPI003CFB5CBB